MLSLHKVYEALCNVHQLSNYDRVMDSLSRSEVLPDGVLHVDGSAVTMGEPFACFVEVLRILFKFPQLLLAEDLQRECEGSIDMEADADGEVNRDPGPPGSSNTLNIPCLWRVHLKLPLEMDNSSLTLLCNAILPSSDPSSAMVREGASVHGRRKSPNGKWGRTLVYAMHGTARSKFHVVLESIDLCECVHISMEGGRLLRSMARHNEHLRHVGIMGCSINRAIVRHIERAIAHNRRLVNAHSAGFLPSERSVSLTAPPSSFPRRMPQLEDGPGRRIRVGGRTVALDVNMPVPRPTFSQSISPASEDMSEMSESLRYSNVRSPPVPYFSDMSPTSQRSDTAPSTASSTPFFDACMGFVLHEEPFCDWKAALATPTQSASTFPQRSVRHFSPETEYGTLSSAAEVSASARPSSDTTHQCFHVDQHIRGSSKHRAASLLNQSFLPQVQASHYPSGASPTEKSEAPYPTPPEGFSLSPSCLPETVETASAPIVEETSSTPPGAYLKLLAKPQLPYFASLTADFPLMGAPSGIVTPSPTPMQLTASLSNNGRPLGLRYIPRPPPVNE